MGHGGRGAEEADEVSGGPTVSAVSWQVNKEEEADENETEWLMEEIDLLEERRSVLSDCWNWGKRHSSDISLVES